MHHKIDPEKLKTENPERKIRRIFSGGGRGLRSRPDLIDLNEKVSPLLKAVDQQLGNQWSNIEYGICLSEFFSGFQEGVKSENKEKVISEKDISGLPKRLKKGGVEPKSLRDIKEDVDGIISLGSKLTNSIRKGISYAIGGMDYEPSESGGFLREEGSESNDDEELDKKLPAKGKRSSGTLGQRDDYAFGTKLITCPCCGVNYFEKKKRQGSICPFCYRNKEGEFGGEREVFPRKKRKKKDYAGSEKLFAAFIDLRNGNLSLKEQLEILAYYQPGYTTRELDEIHGSPQFTKEILGEKKMKEIEDIENEIIESSKEPIEKRSKSISRYDRVQALIRNLQYLQDLEELRKSFTHMRKMGLLKKYEIANLLEPKTWKKMSADSINNTAVFTDEDWIARVIPTDDPKMVPISDPEKRRKMALALGFGGIPDGDIILSTNNDALDLKKERFLTLELNLSSSKDALLRKVEEYIDYYRRYVNVPNTRNTQERKIDKFKVWDEYLQTKDFLKVAEKFTQDKSLVRTAYLRAFELIMGEPYDPIKHDRKKLTKEQLDKTCDICETRDACSLPCPEILAFINQDYRTRREYHIY
jgi:hypothetical protein